MDIISKYRQHIKDLAAQLGCTVHQEPELPGMMFVEFGYVHGPIINNQIDYLTNLHELMHFKHGDTQGRPPHDNKKHYFEAGVLHQEAYAWDESLDQCIDEIQPASRYFMWDVCLGSYYSAYLRSNGKPSRLLNGNRHYVEFVYDCPDEYFTSVVNRIQSNLSSFKIIYKA